MAIIIKFEPEKYNTVFAKQYFFASTQSFFFLIILIIIS